MKKLLAIMLALIMVLCMLPSVAFAEGTATGKAIQNGASGISGYDSTNGYDYIYYGTWNSSPIKWRVLDTKTNMKNATDDGLFLLSDVLLEKVPFQEHTHEAYGSYHKGPGSNSGDHANCLKANAWQGSDAQKWCDKFYTDSLTSQEQGAVLATTKSDKYLYVNGSTNPFDSYNFTASKNILNNDKVFFLSAEEANNSTYGFTNENARVAKDNNDTAYGWWLRSPCVFTFDAGCVNSFGRVSHNNAHHKYAARPAFNLDLNSVLFTSAAVGGKPDGGLNTVPEYAGNEWKLTLKDNSRDGFSVSSAYMEGDSLKISYSGAKTGENEYISVVIMDNNGSITHYGRSASNLTNANGVATIEGMTAMQEGIMLYAFNEQYNGDNMTDYASELKQVTIGDAPTGTLIVTKTVTGNEGDINQYFTFTVTLKMPEITVDALAAPITNATPDTSAAPTPVTETYGDVTFTNGVATFTLKHGESKTIKDIPAGYTYIVTESDNAGYTMTSENDKGTIEGGKTADVKFTNTKGSTPTPTPTPGGGNGGGYFYPTTTPVPVIVIPPKTGDMTVWQSILHFLGIR